MFLWGDSSGGHLALLAALTGTKVKGVVAWFPVTDLIGLLSDVADAGGAPDAGPDSREAQLLGHRRHRRCPIFSAAGEPGDPHQRRRAADPAHARSRGNMVPPAQSIRLAEALRAAGATVELELVPGATHFWTGASDVGGIVRRSIEFLRAHG